MPLTLLVKPARSAATVSETIYIRASGAFEPASAPIQRNGNLYTLTDDVVTDVINGIIIERNNTVLDGGGHTVQGNMVSNSNGIYLDSASNVTIRNTSVKWFHNGIYEKSCSNNCITENSLSQNDYGIYFQSSKLNVISGNSITANTYGGIWLELSQSNSISKNKLSNSIASNGIGGIKLQDFSNYNHLVDNNLTSNKWYGIYIENSGFNHIFHNNFVNNFYQVYDDSSGNLWDDAYPSGGNYWSTYTGQDGNDDGIGDSPYILILVPVIDQDNYPLMNPWVPTETSFTVNGAEFPVTITTNATITRIDPTPDILNFTLSGPNGQTGYVRAIFPRDANKTALKVLINNTDPTPPFPVIKSNSTHCFVYFEFYFSNREIRIFFAIPEYLLGTLSAVASCLAACGLLKWRPSFKRANQL
jgi:parallel beta-helix repeat protein